MTRSTWLTLSLAACLAALLVTACAAAPPALTATPPPSPTPFSRPSDAASPSPTATPAASPTAAPTSGPSATPAATPTAAAPLAGTGSFFALSVADLPASARWYSDKLGLKIVQQPPKSNQASVIVLEGQGLIVELIQSDAGVSLTQIAPSIKDRTLVHGIVKAGVIVADFDQTVALLRARQVTIAYGPYPASATQRANLIIQDNEGNLIQFFGK